MNDVIDPSIWLLYRLNTWGAAKRFMRSLLSLRGLIALSIFACVLQIKGDPNVWKGSEWFVTNLGGYVFFFLFLMFFASGTSVSSRTTLDVDSAFIIAAPIQNKDYVKYRFLTQIIPLAILSLAICEFLPTITPVQVFLRAMFLFLATKAFSFASIAFWQLLDESIANVLQRILGIVVISMIAFTFITIACLGFGYHAQEIGAFILSKSVQNTIAPFFWFCDVLFAHGITYTIITLTITSLITVSSLYFALNNIDPLHKNDLVEEILINAKKLKEVSPRLRSKHLEIKLDNFKRRDGFGSISWRQIQEHCHQVPVVLFYLLLGLGIQAFMAYTMLNAHGGTNKAPPGFAHLNLMAIYFTAMTSLGVSTKVFNSDSIRMEWLKSLPLKTVNVVAGQCTFPTLLLASISFLGFFVNFALYKHFYPQEQLEISSFGFFLLPIPMSFFCTSVMYLAVLIFPAQSKNEKFSLMQFVSLYAFLIVGVVVAASVTEIGSEIFGTYNFGFFTFVAVAFSIFAATAFRATVWAYDRFDVSKISR